MSGNRVFGESLDALGGSSSGEAGLLDRRLGKASPKRVPGDSEQEIERLYRTRYQGFTARHFHEHLVRDHQFTAVKAEQEGSASPYPSLRGRPWGWRALVLLPFQHGG